MEAADLSRRAEIARRLKAARWIAGSVEPNPKGKAGYKVTPLSAEDLARRVALQENGIGADRIGSIERMERHTPPMELKAIAQALDLPEDWFRLRPVPMADPETVLAELARRFGIAGAPEIPGGTGHGLRDDLPSSQDLTRPETETGEDSERGNGG